MQSRVENETLAAHWYFHSNVVALVLDPGANPTPGVAAQVSCPPGETPLELASLSDVLLTNGAPPMARMALSRITLAPGETLDVTPAGFTAYYVESGALKYAFQPGFGISWAPKCTSPNGRYSGSSAVLAWRLMCRSFLDRSA